MSTPPKDDEKALWNALVDGTWPRIAGGELGMPHNRVQYLCHKWAAKGWYEWGVTYDLGWLTPEGKERGRME